MNLKQFSSNCLFLCLATVGYTQIDTLIFTETAALEFPQPNPFQVKSSFTSLLDRGDRPYLFSANMEAGLGIYDISQEGIIDPIIDLDISNFNDVDVTNVKQQNQLLFLSLGDFQSENPSSGLAIVDVSQPETPLIRDVWTDETFVNGVSHLLIEGDYAYLSMMNDGLLILNISNPDTIEYVSDMIPDLNFPAASEGHHQGRGLDFRNDTLFYAFDRGGLRLIDVSNKNMPTEIGQYINTTLTEEAAAAYNDVLIVDHYAFVSVDYCGLEVLDFSTPSITAIDWINPWGCSPFNWNGAELHMNELHTAQHDSLLFVSAGNSELIVFDISNPLNIRRVGEFFELDNNLATYGMDIHGEQISLSYINNPFNIPFAANWGGLKLVDYTALLTTSENIFSTKNDISIYPNPVSNQLDIHSDVNILSFNIYSLDGRLIKSFSEINSNSFTFDVFDMNTGLYMIHLFTKEGQVVKKFLKN